MEKKERKKNNYFLTTLQVRAKKEKLSMLQSPK